MPAFAENSPAQHSANRIAAAVMQLSMADYRVLKFTGGERASIQVDRPFDDAETEPQITHHADKTFGSCDFQGCRVYWEILTETAL